MALKTWIDEIENAESDRSSEAVRGTESAPDRNIMTPGKEDHAQYTETHVHAIIVLAVREIERKLRGTQYRATKELRACEEEVNRRAKAIIEGESSNFDDLRKACFQWVRAVDITPAAPVMTELFEVKS